MNLMKWIPMDTVWFRTEPLCVCGSVHRYVYTCRENDACINLMKWTPMDTVWLKTEPLCVCGSVGSIYTFRENDACVNLMKWFQMDTVWFKTATACLHYVGLCVLYKPVMTMTHVWIWSNGSQWSLFRTEPFCAQIMSNVHQNLPTDMLHVHQNLSTDMLHAHQNL